MADAAACQPAQAVFSKSWAPLKQIGMLAFMMWMSGSQLHLFSIMTTISGIYQPLTAILKSGEGGRELLAQGGTRGF